MKFKKLQIAGAIFSAVSLIFIAGFYTNQNTNEDQRAQLLRFNSSSRNNQNLNSQKPETPVNSLTNNKAIASNPVWRRIIGSDGVAYTEVPQQSIQGVLNFCQQYNSVIPQDSPNKIARRMDDGKLYCINPNGNVGAMCGDGTEHGCVSSGCCGSCIGVDPNSVDLSQIPNVMFIPQTIINSIKSELSTAN